MSRIRLPEYCIQETPLYFDQLAAIAASASFRRLDDALYGVLDDVVKNPESYDLIPGTRLRLAKADGMGVQPGFKILRHDFS